MTTATMRNRLGTLLAGVTILALAATPAFAVWSTNVWTTNGSGYAGDNTNTAHWVPAAMPGLVDQAWFTNGQSAAYTVKFQQSVSNGLFHVGTDKVTFDMNGKLWELFPDSTAPSTWVSAYHADSSQAIAGYAGENGAVTFSSSAAGTNTIIMRAIAANRAFWVGNTTGSGILNINTNLGYGVRVWESYAGYYVGFQNATVNVDGPGAELRLDANYGQSIGSTFNITGGGKITTSIAAAFGNSGYGGGAGNTVNVSRAGILQTGGGNMSYYGLGNVWRITDGGTWNGGDVNMAYLNIGNILPYGTDLLVDGTNSSVTLLGLKIGDLYDGVNYKANARAIVQNGAILAVTNRILVESYTSGLTNRLVLNNATLRLGGGAVNGVLTNKALLQASGTITGLGSTPALVRNEKRLDIGASLGTVTLNNASLELAAGSQTYFEFGDTGLDEIAGNRSASLLGSNIFSLAQGAPAPVHGVKYGLGVYDFVIGTNINNSPQYDNLVNLLTNNYQLTYGVDFHYGVVSLGGGLFALELTFVPEPSTVLLLALGGLFVWRRMVKGRRKTGKSAGAVIAGAVILALAGTPAFAWNTNTWTTDGSGYAGDYNNAAHFSPSVPGQYDQVWFTNQQAAAYKVTFQQGATNGILHVGTDQVTYDLNGKLWSLTPFQGGGWGNNDPDVSQNIAAQAGDVGIVSFSSSSPGTNTFRTGGGYANNFWIGNTSGSAVLNINTNLGYGVRVWLTDGASMLGFTKATVNVQGPGAVLRVDANYGSAVNSTLNITDGGVVDGTVGNTTTLFSGGSSDTVNVSRAGKLLTGNTLVAYYFQGAVWNITDGGIWNGGDVNMANLTVYPNHPVIPYDGQLIVDGSNSIATLRSLRIGDPSGGYYANAKVTIQNGATLAVTNGILVEAYTVAPTNYLFLNNATIRLGGGAAGGVLTNKALLRASGTITGAGSNPALVRNEKRLDIGNSVGTLTLNNANLQLAAGSENYFEFSATGVDQIVVPNGYASLLGTNRFSVIGAGPIAGVKYGLGVYDFVIGTNVNNSPQYDNLVNLLTNNYSLTYGVDFQYGVVNLGGGLFALELTFVPEPSTVILLGLGALLAWRRMAKGRRTGKGRGAVIACALVLALAGTPSFAVVLTNSWTTDGSTYSGNNNNAAHWSPGTPGTVDQVWFTNQQAAAYTVTFQQSVTNGPLKVGTDKINFDLNGKLWAMQPDPVFGGDWYGGNFGHIAERVAGVAGENATLSFSSSTPGTNTVRMFGGYCDAYFGNASGGLTLNINTNLGYGAKVVESEVTYIFNFNHATVNVAGPGAELGVYAAYGSAANSILNVTDGGRVNATPGNNTSFFSNGANNTVNVSRAGMLLTGNTMINYFYPGAVWNITDGGIWNGGDVNMANLTVYPNHPVIPYDGQLLVDGSNSTVTLRSLRIGDPSGNYYVANGKVTVQNGATLAVTNSILVEDYAPSAYTTSMPTNTLVLNNATILLGGGAVNGVLSNRAIIQAAGTITGQGAGNFTIRNLSDILVLTTNALGQPTLATTNNATFRVGSPTGRLTLNKGNLQSDPNTKTLFSFGDTTLSQIVATNGFVSLLGTNLFSLATGAPSPLPGVKYGLGVYNFVIGTNVTSTPQYDNLVNLLTNNYHLTYGVDFHYGVVNLGGGLFALELTFVPEPSTVILLALGGLMIWRRMARRPVASRK